MRRLLLSLALPLLAVLAPAQDVPPTVSFKTEKATYRPGEDIKGTVTVTFAPGLHGYQNPPDPDFLLPVKVNPAEGTVIKSVKYPAGHREMAGGVEAMSYSGTIEIPVVVAAPKGTGKQTIGVSFFYQQCDAETCYLPSSIPASTVVTIEAAQEAPPAGEVENVGAGVRTAPGTAMVTVNPIEGPVKTGSEVRVTIRVGPSTGLYLLASDSSGVRPLLSGPDLVSYSVAKAGYRTVKGKPTPVHVEPFDVSAVIKVPSDGSRSVTLSLEYVLADKDGPFEPRQQAIEVPFQLETAPPQDQGTAEPPVDTTEETPESDGLLGFLNNALEKGNWALIVPAALLVGLALCLTPCVFPMIPVTVTFFSNQGSKTKAGRFSLGLFYALGIAVTYGAVGGIAAASRYAVGALFTKPWFVLLLAALLIALALSMFDVYEIRLPGFIQRNLKGRSGPVGALIMGLLMGFAAAPCAGALVGAVAVKVAEIGSVPVGLGMFGLIGLGMGLPFMALATASSGAKALPKSGGWLKTTKAVLGLLVLYFAMTYVFQGLGMKPDEAGTQVAWIAVFLAFAAYLLFLDKSDATRAVATIKGATCVALGVLAGMAYSEYGKIKLRESLADSPTQTDSQVTALGINWVPYDEESFAKAVASGKPIMIDGKADWCVQCREIEHGVFNTAEGLKALTGVYLMSIDWSTGVDPAYIEATKKRFGILGLPHIVFMEPGGKNEFAVKDIKSVEELRTHLRKVGAKL